MTDITRVSKESIASGYWKVLSYESAELVKYGAEVQYELTLTNYEVERMFYSMVRGWFRSAKADYNDFVSALFQNDLEATPNRERIRKYGFAFKGKQVLMGE